jgi:anti-anti-sigma factor
LNAADPGDTLVDRDLRIARAWSSAVELLGVREIAAREGAVVVEFTGECDSTRQDAVGALFARLLEENELVVVDVRRVTFLDSSFLHSLYLANHDARARGVRFCLQVGKADIPYRVLQISRLLDQVEHFETREEILPVQTEEPAAAT